MEDLCPIDTDVIIGLQNQCIMITEKFGELVKLMVAADIEYLGK
jgi:hypothetical protein